MTWTRHWRRGLDFARVYRVARLACRQLVSRGHMLPSDVDDVVQQTVADVAAHDAPTNDRFVSLVAMRRAWGLAKRDRDLARRFGARFDPLVACSDVFDDVESQAGEVPPVSPDSFTGRVLASVVQAATPSHETLVVERVSFGEVFDAWLAERPTRAEPRGDTRQARAARRHSFITFGRRFVAREPRVADAH